MIDTVQQIKLQAHKCKTLRHEREPSQRISDHANAIEAPNAKVSSMFKVTKCSMNILTTSSSNSRVPNHSLKTRFLRNIALARSQNALASHRNECGGSAVGAIGG